MNDPLTPHHPASDASGPGPAQDLIELLTADHRTVEELFVALEHADGDVQRRKDLTDVMIAELMRHNAAEEQCLYPAARRLLPDGDELAERELAEHRAAELAMDILMNLDPAHPDFRPMVDRLICAVRAHIQEEETALFPRLRAACDAETLVGLGTEVLSTKKLAPTRPHPGGPHEPPFNRLAGPFVGLFDQAVDTLTDRPTSVEELQT